MLERFKKSLTIILIVTLLFLRVSPVLALDPPSAPTPPPAPQESTTVQSIQTPPPAPTATAAPTPPPAPTSPPAPTPPSAPKAEDLLNKSKDSTTTNSDSTVKPDASQEISAGSTTGTSSQPSATSGNTTSGGSTAPKTTSGVQTGSQTKDGQAGDTKIDTGSATNNGNISTVANTNVSAGIIANSGPGGITIINDSNGSNSDNSGSVNTENNKVTDQKNNAVVVNDLNQDTNTGKNSASGNVGNSEITTGNANTSGTVMTAVNTNIEGVGVAEFSVMDDHVGDIVLDFSANCVYGCVNGNLTAKNSDNGTLSDNSADITQTNNNITNQTNDALIESNLNLSSNSGKNDAKKNTNGDSTIATGDANVAGNVLNFANNNLAGVYFNFVYIYGDLIGDIILPEEYFKSAPCNTCSGGDILASNIGNGTDSTNNALINTATSDQTYQFNNAEIENNLFFDATTGNNDTSKNTGGNSSIETGNTNVNGQVLNVANSNVSGGDWWLLLVNEAGNWIGKILGAPVGSGTYAGSDGTQFSVDEYGVITAVNSGNGSGSTNNASITDTTNNTTVQTNNAKIVNNINLSANTGGNSASKNTGGNSSITTGDANIIASIVNMVNNNFSSGRLFVTVVDVFGSWIGDFLAPGYTKKALASEQTTQGGVEDALAENVTNPSSEENHDLSQANKGGTSSDSNEDGVTVLNTSTIKPQGAVLAYVAKLSTSGGGSVRVAGFQVGNILGIDTEPISTKVDSKKTININLAWLIIIIPALLIAAMAIRKYRFIRNR